MDITDKELGQSKSLILAAETDDELGTVLRLHLALEHLLDFYLKQKRLGEVASFVREPREFGAKLSLAVAFGFPVIIARVYRQVNIIRNKLAHEPGESIGSGDVQELARKVNGLSEIDPSFTSVERKYVELAKKMPGEKLGFGSSGARIDVLIAIVAAYSFSVQWLVTNHYEPPQVA
jgi:hypothetical protein